MSYPPVPDPADPEHPADPGAALTRLRDQLRWRLAWAQKEFDLPVDADPIAVVETLKSRSWLRDEEAGLTCDLLSESVHRLLDLSRQDQRDFLRSAWPFVWRLRVVVFDRAARSRFTDCGWSICDFEQPPEYRPDFAAHKGDVWLRVSARVIDDEDSPTLRRALDRLNDTPDLPWGPATGLVVIPRTAPQTDVLDSSPRRLKLPVDGPALGAKLDELARYQMRKSGND